ncbi:hypothetical protein AX17_006770 [Amanita inopinata Kibby_2008]|nr:hypothetical protein AX17_006770 [Amanita inopinata Kibby_2008]
MKRNEIHADISHILDPSYSPASAKQQPLAVYVDRHGYIHDPDYRQFPTIVPPNNQSQNDDDDDATAIDNDFYSHLTNAYNRAGNAYVNPRKRQNNQYSHIYAAYRSPYHYFSTPEPTSSYSPPASYDSDATVFDEADDSPFVDESHSPVNTLKKRFGKRRGSSSSNNNSSTCSPSRRRRSGETEPRSSWPAGDNINPSPRLSSDEPRHRHIFPHDELDEQCLAASSSSPSQAVFDLNGHPSQVEDEKQEWTPTCTQNLRRQWQAISLRFRFSWFRAQRRVKRRIQSLI